MIVPGILVCSIFLISVCMFIVSKDFLISSATVIVRAGRAIWLNPFATVLYNVCSAVIVECCVLYPYCVGVFGMLAVMEGRRLFSSRFAITERRDMGLYEVPVSMYLLGFGMGTMIANFQYERNLIILQVNINGLRNKLEELKLLIHDTHVDQIQETKLTHKVKTPKIHNFTAVRTDRLHKA